MTTAGRPRSLDDYKKREVCALLAAGETIRFAAKYIDCHVSTIRKEARRDPRFGDSLRHAQMSAQIEPLRAIRGKATTHWRAAAWLLERSAPERFGRLDQKYFTPQEVADLVANIRVSLEAKLPDIGPQLIIWETFNRVVAEAGLPQGRACNFANLSHVLADMPPELRKSLESAAASILHEDDPHTTHSAPAPPRASDDDSLDACDDLWDDDGWDEADDDPEQFTASQEKNSSRFAPLSQSLPEELGATLSRREAKVPNTSPKIGTPAVGERPR